jgi:hypothetical protein
MDVAEDGVWMTYGEVAVARGVKRSAAIKLAQRHKWRKQAGNDGLARVLVPGDMAKPGDRARDVRADVPIHVSGDVAAYTVAFESALAALREAQDRERAGWTEERTRLADTIDGLRQDLEVARMALAEAEADAAELRQAETVRQRRGRWARLRAAWRGE